MPNKMLIDASHPEETRVVVVRGNRIEEFDFESQDKKQLKGNIYLARVTRVEPSLQAAFIEYGGNRHGFLAFSEIHPDYYQIPVADRQALIRAEAEAAEAEDEEDEDRHDRGRGRRRRRGARHRGRDEGDVLAADGAEPVHDTVIETGEETSDDGDGQRSADTDEVGTLEDNATEPDQARTADSETDDDDARGGRTMAAAIESDVISEPLPEPERNGAVEEVPGANGDEHEVESVGAEDALEEARNRRRPMRRNYKIQEVIKRRQILLVQVVKEERGNKGAALTTYLSLAGRYSVLMPNTARGGGISRKITNAQDRKRLKEVVQDLEVPDGMGVILRTAGESRTKAEIKRDYEYLMRMWETVRNTTLQSTAPALVYEEGSLIKRSVRDLYNKDIDEILVAGEDGYREAKDFMRMLMPSHAKAVQPYRDTVPIFARNGIEGQLDKMLQPQVTLRSGGYIIINQTEALVAIDVNSGRSTREHSIEDTALQTNLEAAEEVARQLRLRDLAGLIVIDFIDMEENRNNRSVEKKLKDCLKNDRARIQVGRISHFGLLEMSRQRIRASVLESTMKPCPHCGGTGHVRSESSVALMVIRAIEEFLLKDARNHITVKTPTATALYILNHKRSMLVDLENRFALRITVEADETLATQHYAIFRGAVADKPAGHVDQIQLPPPPEPEDDIEVEETEDEEVSETAESPVRRDADDGRRRRRRRRRRGGRDGERRDTPGDVAATPEAHDDAEEEAGDGEAQAPAAVEADGNGQKKRRRGKRGGRRNRHDGDDQPSSTELSEAASDPDGDTEPTAPDGTDAGSQVDEAASETPAPAVPKRRQPRERRSRTAEATPAVLTEVNEAASTDEDEAPSAHSSETAETTETAKPTRRRQSVKGDEPVAPVVSSVVAGQPVAEPAAEPKKGWWQRKGFF
ncbi:MAG: Rne/Rng family ribonuclease [Rhizobiaceae bacterium]